jgi:hypothetical protein
MDRRINDSIPTKLVDFGSKLVGMELDNMLKQLEKGLSHHIYSEDDVEHDVSVIGDTLIELIKYLKDKANER